MGCMEERFLLGMIQLVRFFVEIRLTKPDQEAEIWIAYARGNQILRGDNKNDDLGASILFGGIAKSAEEPKRSELLRSIRGNRWTDVFHNYTVLWEPGR